MSLVAARTKQWLKNRNKTTRKGVTVKIKTDTVPRAAKDVGLRLGSKPGLYNLLRRDALFAFFGCGFAGVLVDIDHPIGYLLGLSGRFLHTPLLAASGFVLCGCGAYLGGLLLGKVLKQRQARSL
jgi:hypothetical protein